MADDVEFGHVVDLTLGEPSGTELVADAAVGATALLVDYAGDFDDAGDGFLNGAAVAFTSIDYGDAETDPDTVNLAAPLAVAASKDDKFVRMAGGEQVLDWLLHVSLGDGHPVDIPIPFEQRALWASVDLTTPVPVLVSADLERLIEVPGRMPKINPANIGSDLFQAYLATDGGRAGGLNIPGGTDTTVADWTVTAYDPDAFAYDGSGRLTLRIPGSYLSVVTVTWAPNTSNRRETAMTTTTLGVDNEEVRIAMRPDADVGIASHQVELLHRTTEADVQLRALVYQNTGAGLALDGNSAGTLTNWRVLRLR